MLSRRLTRWKAWWILARTGDGFSAPRQEFQERYPATRSG